MSTNNNLGLVLIFLLLLPIWSCNNSTTQNKKTPIDTIKDFSEDRLDEAFDKAVIVFYSLPSPIETARIFKRAGATFDESILNPSSNSGNYLTNRDIALNLGAYGADLSYSNLFEQSQITVNYFAVTKRMAQNLGITEVLNDTTINLLKENINDRDYVMGIISDVFMNSQSYLKENHRPEVASLIVAGGWIEGLYIGTQLAANSKNRKSLISAVADQRLSAEDLINLLKVYEDNKYIKNVKKDVVKILEILKKVKNNNDEINEEKFKELYDFVEKVRNSFTQI